MQVYKIFASPHSSMEEMKRAFPHEFALDMPNHTPIETIEAADIEEAVSIFCEKYDQLPRYQWWNHWYFYLQEPDGSIHPIPF